jgi:hypothetical protein
MKFSPLTDEEIAASGGFTHRLDFSYRDIPTGIANNTAKTWGAGYLPAVAASDFVAKTELHLTTPFAVTSDAAFNSSTISFGDVTTATRYVNASEANLNGTEVLDVVPGAATNAIYTAAGQLQLTLNAMANKTVSSLNAGQAYILVEIHRAAHRAREAATPFGAGTTTTN